MHPGIETNNLLLLWDLYPLYLGIALTILGYETGRGTRTLAKKYVSKYHNVIYDVLLRDQH